MRIRILDPAYHFDADPGPELAYLFDPDPTFQFDVNPCGSGSTTLQTAKMFLECRRGHDYR